MRTRITTTKQNTPINNRNEIEYQLNLFGEIISKTNRRSVSFTDRIVHKRKSGTMIE